MGKQLNYLQLREDCDQSIGNKRTGNKIPISQPQTRAPIMEDKA